MKTTNHFKDSCVYPAERWLLPFTFVIFLIKSEREIQRKYKLSLRRVYTQNKRLGWFSMKYECRNLPKKTVAFNSENSQKSTNAGVSLSTYFICKCNVKFQWQLVVPVKWSAVSCSFCQWELSCIWLIVMKWLQAQRKTNESLTCHSKLSLRYYTQMVCYLRSSMPVGTMNENSKVHVYSNTSTIIRVIGHRQINSSDAFVPYNSCIVNW